LTAPGNIETDEIPLTREQIGSCTHHTDTQLYTSCDHYCPTLVQLFSPYPEAD